MPPTRNRVKALRRVRAGDLLPNPRNWRRHPDAQRRALRALLDDVGYADALLVRETPAGLELIDGHLRAETTPEDKVPVLVLDVNEAEADKLLASLDPLAAMAEANSEALAALLGSVELPADLLAHLNSLVPKVAGLTDPDEIPEPPRKPLTKVGDLWLLGDHRLLCGDATSASSVAQLLDGEHPALCVTDPPYGVDYDPAWRQRAAKEGKLAYAARRVGEVTNDDRRDWRAAWELVPSDVLYCWHAGRHASTVQAGLEAAGFEIRCQIIWVKPHFPISRGHYHWRHEPCWYAVRQGASAAWSGDRKQTTVWDITLDPNAPGGHSTQKPCECMERPIRNHRGDVYDPFVGSGTTIIAAERTGRRCFAMDLEPTYVDVAVTRWEQFTGKKAKRERA